MLSSRFLGLGALLFQAAKMLFSSLEHSKCEILPEIIRSRKYLDFIVVSTQKDTSPFSTCCDTLSYLWCFSSVPSYLGTSHQVDDIPVQ